MDRTRHTPLVVLLLIAGLLLAACSGGASKAKFCGKAGDLKDFGSSLGKANSLSEVKSGFSKLSKKINQAADAAPSDIKKDVDAIRKAFDQVDFDVQKANSKDELSKLSSKFDALTNNADLKSAGDRVTSYAKKNCNVDLSS